MHCRFEKVIVSTSYPRNGNVHNPTQYVEWVVLYKGKRVDAFSTLKQAKIAAKAFEAAPEW